jgi:hypothetical protein
MGQPHMAGNRFCNCLTHIRLRVDDVDADGGQCRPQGDTGGDKGRGKPLRRSDLRMTAARASSQTRFATSTRPVNVSLRRPLRSYRCWFGRSSSSLQGLSLLTMCACAIFVESLRRRSATLVGEFSLTALLALRDEGPVAALLQRAQAACRPCGSPCQRQLRRVRHARVRL